MRTKTAILSAVALAAGLASSMAQANVYSVNIVGYVNQTFPGGNALVAVANPLSDGTNTLDSLLKAKLPFGATVQFWNGTGFNLVTRVQTFVNPTGWNPASGSTPLPPGVGLFVKAGANPVTNTWVGQVLTGSLTNAVNPGLSFIGNQVPVAADAVTNGLAASLAFNDTVQKWNGAGYDFYKKVQSFVSPTGWKNAANANVAAPFFNVGEGFFINNALGTDWTQSFNPNN
ncbi:MAG: hypothetical protein ACTHLW_14985 [Verrucomicrobiota bacterium]